MGKSTPASLSSEGFEPFIAKPVVTVIGAVKEMWLTWNTCKGNVWCGLGSVDLNHKHFDDMEGVYIIWCGGDEPATIRVGQGVIRDRLRAHRNDEDIQAYKDLVLYVTWALVAPSYRDGVEAYLADILEPLVGERFPDRTQIEVNLPWKVSPRFD